MCQNPLLQDLTGEDLHGLTLSLREFPELLLLTWMKGYFHGFSLAERRLRDQKLQCRTPLKDQRLAKPGERKFDADVSADAGDRARVEELRQKSSHTEGSQGPVHDKAKGVALFVWPA